MIAFDFLMFDKFMGRIVKVIHDDIKFTLNNPSKIISKLSNKVVKQHREIDNLKWIV